MSYIFDSQTLNGSGIFSQQIFAGTTATSDLSITWESLVTSSKDLSIQWNSTSYVSANLTIANDMNTFSFGDFMLRYNINTGNAVVYSDLSIAFSSEMSEADYIILQRKCFMLRQPRKDNYVRLWY